MQILKYIFIGLLIFLTCGCGGKKKQGEFRYFRNYQRTFNDLNDKHLKAARQWGIHRLLLTNCWKSKWESWIKSAPVVIIR